MSFHFHWITKTGTKQHAVWQANKHSYKFPKSTCCVCQGVVCSTNIYSIIKLLSEWACCGIYECMFLSNICTVVYVYILIYFMYWSVQATSVPLYREQLAVTTHRHSLPLSLPLPDRQTDRQGEKEKGRGKEGGRVHHMCKIKIAIWCECNQITAKNLQNLCC